jgi:predicted nucleic acid-binding protein
MNYLLDTNVLSDARKRSPDHGVREWLGRVHPDDLRVSVVTIAEIRRGVSRLRLRRDHRQANVLDEWLATTRREYADRLVQVSAEVADAWGHLDAGRQALTTDGLIAATAQVHGWTVVTRNVAHFEPAGVRVLDPFTA